MLTSLVLSMAVGVGSIVGNPTIKCTMGGAPIPATDPINCVEGDIEVKVTTDNATDYVCGFIIQTDANGLPQMRPAVNSPSGTTWTLLWEMYKILGDGQILRIECHSQTGAVETRDYTLNVVAKVMYSKTVKDEEKIKINQTTAPVGGGTVSSEGTNKGLHHVGYLLKLDANGRPMGKPIAGKAKMPPMGKSWKIDFENVPNPGAGNTDIYLQVVRSRNKENPSIETKRIEVRGN